MPGNLTACPLARSCLPASVAVGLSHNAGDGAGATGAGANGDGANGDGDGAGAAVGWTVGAWQSHSMSPGQVLFARLGGCLPQPQWGAGSRRVKYRLGSAINALPSLFHVDDCAE